MEQTRQEMAERHRKEHADMQARQAQEHHDMIARHDAEHEHLKARAKDVLDTVKGVL